MTTHPSAEAGISQADAILGQLKQRKGKWCSMPSLGRISGSYNVHSRIADLRKRGHQIEHRNEHAGRLIRSYYRLAE